MKPLICTTIFFILLLGSHLQAAFENRIENALINAAAGNGSVLADGVMGMGGNPAVSGSISNFEVFFVQRSMNEKYENTTALEIAGAMAFSLREYGAGGVSLESSGYSGLYKEFSFLINYSYKLDGKTQVGANIRYQGWTAEMTKQIYYDIDIEQWKNNFFSFDAGVLRDIGHNRYLAFSLNDIALGSPGKSQTSVKHPFGFKSGIGKRNSRLNYETGILGADRLVRLTGAIDYKLSPKHLDIVLGFGIKLGTYDSIIEDTRFDALGFGARVRLKLIKGTDFFFMYSLKYQPDAVYGNVTESSLSTGFKI